jgi:hypothetical protein
MRHIIQTYLYHSIWVAAATTVLLSSCRKDEVTFNKYGPSTGEVRFLLISAASQNTTTLFDLRPNGVTLPDTILTTASGLQVALVDTEVLFEGMTGTDIPCSTCGSIRVEITEIPLIADLLANQISTMSDGKLCQSGAMVRIRAFCDGQPLALRPDRHLRILIPSAATPTNMQVYYASALEETVTNWSAGTPDNVYWADWMAQGQPRTGYDISAQQLGWIAAMRPLDTVVSRLCVKLAPQFDSDNTLVWMLAEGQTQSLVELTRGPDDTFCTQGIPTGIPIRLFTISKTGPAYWLSELHTETGSNQTITLQPGTIEADALIEWVTGL